MTAKITRSTDHSINKFLERQPMLLRVVAGLARGHQVAFVRPAAADDRDQVVHGQRLGTYLSPAVMAYPAGTAAFPPLRRAQLARLGALAPDGRVVDLDQKAHGRSLSQNGRGITVPT